MLSPTRTITLRLPQGEADYALMAEIALLANQADNVDDVLTAEDAANFARNPVNPEASEPILLLAVDGQTAAWQITHWRREENGRGVYMLFGHVHPEWRRQGLGTHLVRHGEQQLRAVAAQHAAEGAPPGYFQTFSPTNRASKVALFEREGYQVVRHFYDMIRPDLEDVPDAALPAGFELRPVLADDRAVLRQIWDANEEAFRDHWGFTQLGDNDFNRLLESPNFDPSLWRVAWETATNQVAGVTINTIPAASNAVHNRKLGWVDDLSVGRANRKRGLGRALLANSLLAFRERGLTMAGLGVDTENLSGALRLYEAVGFKAEKHAVALRKELVEE
jgi:mycothiol synthase